MSDTCKTCAFWRVDENGTVGVHAAFLFRTSRARKKTAKHRARAGSALMINASVFVGTPSCALAVIECVQEMGQKPSGTATPAE
jgi:hypothetical protein